MLCRKHLWAPSAPGTSPVALGVSPRPVAWSRATAPSIDDRRVLRIGILGAARIAPTAIVKPSRRTKKATVVAVAARDRHRAVAFAAKHHVDRVLDSYEELVTDPEVDAVYNPLPNGLHGHWTIAALKAGKHVLCEKPFTANADEARSVVEVTGAHPGLVVMEAFHYQYHPLTRRLIEIIRSGELGPVSNIDVAFSAPLRKKATFATGWTWRAGPSWTWGATR